MDGLKISCMSISRHVLPQGFNHRRPCVTCMVCGREGAMTPAVRVQHRKCLVIRREFHNVRLQLLWYPFLTVTASALEGHLKLCTAGGKHARARSSYNKQQDPSRDHGVSLSRLHLSCILPLSMHEYKGFAVLTRSLPLPLRAFVQTSGTLDGRENTP